MKINKPYIFLMAIVLVYSLPVNAKLTKRQLDQYGETCKSICVSEGTGPVYDRARQNCINRCIVKRGVLTPSK